MTVFWRLRGQWISSQRGNGIVERKDIQSSSKYLCELTDGIARLPADAKTTRLQVWLGQVLAQRYSGRVLPIDQIVAARCGELQARAEKRGSSMPVIDGAAGTAAVHSLAIVTRNTDDMVRSGVEILHPWST